MSFCVGPLLIPSPPGWQVRAAIFRTEVGELRILVDQARHHLARVMSKKKQTVAGRYAPVEQDEHRGWRYQRATFFRESSAIIVEYSAPTNEYSESEFERLVGLVDLAAPYSLKSFLIQYLAIENGRDWIEASLRLPGDQFYVRDSDDFTSEFLGYPSEIYESEHFVDVYLKVPGANVSTSAHGPNRLKHLHSIRRNSGFCPVVGPPRSESQVREPAQETRSVKLSGGDRDEQEIALFDIIHDAPKHGEGMLAGPKELAAIADALAEHTSIEADFIEQLRSVESFEEYGDLDGVLHRLFTSDTNASWFLERFLGPGLTQDEAAYLVNALQSEVCKDLTVEGSRTWAPTTFTCSRSRHSELIESTKGELWKVFLNMGRCDIEPQGAAILQEFETTFQGHPSPAVFFAQSLLIALDEANATLDDLVAASRIPYVFFEEVVTASKEADPVVYCVAGEVLGFKALQCVEGWVRSITLENCVCRNRFQELWFRDH